MPLRCISRAHMLKKETSGVRQHHKVSEATLCGHGCVEEAFVDSPQISGRVRSVSECISANVLKSTVPVAPVTPTFPVLIAAYEWMATRTNRRCSSQKALRRWDNVSACSSMEA